MKIKSENQRRYVIAYRAMLVVPRPLAQYLARLLLIELLSYGTEIRKVLCPTNAIESLDARYRRVAHAGIFPLNRPR